MRNGWDRHITPQRCEIGYTKHSKKREVRQGKKHGHTKSKALASITKKKKGSRHQFSLELLRDGGVRGGCAGKLPICGNILKAIMCGIEMTPKHRVR